MDPYSVIYSATVWILQMFKHKWCRNTQSYSESESEKLSPPPRIYTFFSKTCRSISEKNKQTALRTFDWRKWKWKKENGQKQPGSFEVAITQVCAVCKKIYTFLCMNHANYACLINHALPLTMAKCWQIFWTSMICNIRSIRGLKLEKMAKKLFFA